MADAFASTSDEISAPARRVAAIAPNDGADLSELPKAIYVGGAGDLALIAAGDTVSCIFKNLPAASIVPVRARRVMSTGTTATALLLLY
jgi:hypothetical protein